MWCAGAMTCGFWLVLLLVPLTAALATAADDATVDIRRKEKISLFDVLRAVRR